MSAHDDEDTARSYAMIDALIDLGERAGANPDDSLLIVTGEDAAEELGNAYRGYRVHFDPNAVMDGKPVPPQSVVLAKRSIKRST